MERNKEHAFCSDNRAKYVLKFKELYKRKEGKDLTNQEALDYFENLVTLVTAVYKPIPTKYGK